MAAVTSFSNEESVYDVIRLTNDIDWLPVRYYPKGVLENSSAMKKYRCKGYFSLNF